MQNTKIMCQYILCLLLIMPNLLNAMLSLPLKVSKWGILAVKHPIEYKDLYAKHKDKLLVKRDLIKKNNKILYQPRKTVLANSIDESIVEIDKTPCLNDSDNSYHAKNIKDECLLVLQDYEKIFKLINKDIELEACFRYLTSIFDKISVCPLTGNLIIESIDRDLIEHYYLMLYGLMYIIYDASKSLQNMNKEELLLIVNNKYEIATLSLKEILNEFNFDLEISDSLNILVENYLKNMKSIIDLLLNL